MNIDIENRLHLAFASVLGKDSALEAMISTRIYRHRDKSHKPTYPCATIAIPSCHPFGPREGWYRATVMVMANTYLHADATGEAIMRMAGAIRGVLQSGKLELDLNNSAPAKANATALTVVEAVVDESAIIEEEANVRSIGLAVAVVARPSFGQNNG